jgi:hypothetical protein
VTSLEMAREIADAVLFEGYLLYPYRANDAKNQVRWQFGVLAPPAFAEIDRSEHSWLQTQCVVEGHDVELAVQVRFLQVQRRGVEQWDGQIFRPVHSLDVDDATYLPCDEAIVVERIVHVSLPGFAVASDRVAISVPGGEEFELLADAAGMPAGRLARNREPLQGVLTVDAVPLPGPFGVRRLQLRLDNCTPWTAIRIGNPARPEALRHALVAAHLLVASTHGSFVSQIDPPEWARGFVEECEQVGCFPVLAGPPGVRDLVFASPIILYDHPQVAPESEAQFCDATEMDEMLTLRTLTLTDAEKRVVRGSDPKAAALIDHVDHLPPALLDRLHGAIRSMSSVARPAAPAQEPPPPWWDPGTDASVDPDTDFVLIGDVAVCRGSSVVLRPGGTSTDAQDMFLAGRAATVEAVIFDVDGGTHVAVSLDDLVEDGYHPHGRFLYFAPDEVEPIAVSA